MSGLGFVSGTPVIGWVILILVAGFAINWAMRGVGRAVRMIRSAPNDSHVASMRDHVRAMEDLARDLVLLLRSSGLQVAVEDGTDEPVVLHGQSEAEVTERLRRILAKGHKHFNDSDRGVLLSLGTPARLAVIFATDPAYADTLWTFASGWHLTHRGERSELRKVLQQTRQMMPVAAIATETQATATGRKPEHREMPELAGVGAGLNHRP